MIKFFTLFVIIFLFADFSWSQKDALRPVRAIELLNHKEVLLAATDGSGIMSSSDFGKTWIKKNVGLPDLSITSIEKLNNTLFVTVEGYGIYVSNDDAKTWTKSSFDGKGEIKLFALNDSKILANPSKKGIYVTSNFPENWDMINSDFKNEMSCAVSNSGNIIYGTKEKGIYVSKDNGRTIENSFSGLSNFGINALTIKNNIIFAATNGGIFSSTDNAKNWVLVEKGLEKAQIYSFATKGDTLFAGSNPFGVLVSIDNGKTWKDYNSGLKSVFIKSIIVHNEALYLGTLDGIYVSKDNALTWENLNVFDSLPKFKKEKIKGELSLIKTTNIGYEFSKPFLKSGTNSLDMWQGFFVDAGGYFSGGFSTGMASYKDESSGKTLYMRGVSGYMGVQMFLSKRKSQKFNIFPFYGGGFMGNSLQNNIKLNNADFNKNNTVVALGIGMYATTGLVMILGPVVVKAKIQAQACANFNKANDLKAIQLVPSITIGFKNGYKWLRPKTLKATGNHIHKEIESSTYLGTETKITYHTEYHPETFSSYAYKVDVKTTTVTPIYHHTYKDVYTAGSIQVDDVGKHFFIAPKLEGSIISTKNMFALAYGLQTGFRVKRLLLEFNYTQGNFGMKDLVPKMGEKNNFYTEPMDGYFQNSVRIGMKLGRNMMYYKNSTRFTGNTSADQKNVKKAEKATKPYGVIPNIGFGIMSLGDFKFSNVNGENSYKNYFSSIDSTNTNSLENIPYNHLGITNQKGTGYLTLGLNIFLGVVSLEYDLFIVKGKTLNHTVGVAIKFPVLRLFNSKNK